MNDVIREKAEYCLNCLNKPCSMNGCPINTKIPEFINEIKNGDNKKAIDILHENNIMSHICSIVCPQEDQCEGSCIRGIKGKPTEIGKLEKYINEWAIENNYEYLVNKKQSNGKKVAIIGSGPSSIGCAYELLKEGFEVDIYEKEKLPGGNLVFGIPDFRLDKKLVNIVIDKLKNLGANFILEKELGKDYNLKEISEKYDYVFLGIGVYKSTMYKLSDIYLDGVYSSIDFLKKYYNKEFIDNLGTVVVIGGGNVAMDCSRTAIKMGAKKVKILYRRDKLHMPAREVELEEAIQDGVEFHELTRVISANVDELNNKKIISLNCIKTEIIDGKAVNIEGKEFIEEADSVIFAIGLKPEKELIESQGIELNEFGYIKVDESGKTNIENVYTGGDIVGEKATVCKALSSGKKVAQKIIQKFHLDKSKL